MKKAGQEVTLSLMCRRVWEEYRYAAAVAIFFLLFHIFIKPDYWDDAVYSKALEKFRYDIIAYTRYRYGVGSSRIFIEICLSVVAALPDIVWKVLDVFMAVLLYLELDCFAEYALHIQRRERKAATAALLCAYPFSSMASAGWMATTTNYLWVVALGLYVINKVIKVAAYRKKLSAPEVICTFLAVLYSGSHELMAAILFFVLGATLVLQWKKGKDKASIILQVLFLAVVCLLIYIACCPGNRQRILSDTENWMPEYFQLGVIDKLRMGMVMAFLHFVSIPNAVFFLFSVFCFLGTFYGTGQWYKRLIALLPVGIDCIWSAYYLISYFTGENVMTYQAPTPLLGGDDTGEQIVLWFSLSVWLGAACCAIYWSFLEKQRVGICMLLLGIGCAPELVLGFTPTVVGSMLRTVIYLYMVMLLVILCIWDEIYEKMKKNNRLRAFVLLVVIVGICLNVVQMIRHILVYG